MKLMNQRLRKTLIPLTLAMLPQASATTVAPVEPLSLDCLIEPRITTDISTRAEGVVQEFFFDRGDRVEKGQILATLDAEVEKASVALAKTRAELIADIKASKVSLGYGNRKARRFDGLFKQKAVAAHTLDEARTEALLAAHNLSKAEEDRRVAELQLQQARETLELRTIRSPISGIVVDRMLDIGESVEDKPIIQVAQIDPLYVEVIAPVTHFARVSKGMQGVVVPEEPIGGEYRATVTVVDQIIDAASGTFRIRLELPNPDHKLPAGLKCNVRFSEEAPQATQQSADSQLPEASEPTTASTEFEQCFSIGPMSRLTQAQAVAAAVDSQQVDLEIRQTTANPAKSFIARSTPFSSQEAAQALQRRLRAHGLTDIAVMGHGPLANHLSFGLYDQQAYAEKRCDQLLTLGTSCIAEPAPSADTLVWVDLAFSSPEFDTQRLHAWLDPTGLASRINPRICDTSASVVGN